MCIISKLQLPALYICIHTAINNLLSNLLMEQTQLMYAYYMHIIVG